MKSESSTTQTRHLSKALSSHSEAEHGQVLPLEIWRIVFMYLPLKELCRCSQVCREWNLLVSSLDSTIWKRLFLQNSEWRHPLWPHAESSEETLRSWQILYREHFHASRSWLKIKDIPSATSCMSIFPRKRERKTIRVGPYYKHENLRSALSVAGEYDRIVIAPGFYDEQFEMFSKIPFELVGEGNAESVVLVMSIEQNAVTGRLCNLTLKAPWFTSHVIKVKHGHLQMDKCHVEEGVMAVEHPATCHLRYCKFRKAQVVSSHLSFSIVEHCEFVGLDAAAISIEGYPKDSRNWAHDHMHKGIDTWGLHQEALQDRGADYGDMHGQSCHSLDTLKLQNLSIDGSVDGQRADVDSIGGATSIGGSQASMAHTNTYDASSFSSAFTETDQNEVKGHEWNSEETSAALAAAQASLDRPSSSSSSSSAASGLSAIHQGLNTSKWSDELDSVESILRFNFEASLETDSSLREAIKAVKGCVISRCRIKDCHGGVAVSQQGQARIEKCDLLDLLYGVRCVQNAKVAVLGNSIHHCVTSGIFFRSAAHGVIGGNDIYCTNEAGIDIRKGADPLVQCNRLHHGKRSGIVVLGSGCGTIKCNDIYQNREAGIYILYKGNPYVSGNRIVHGGAAGIAINEEGRGCIVDNVIKGNRWGGIDIRKGSDPLVTHNYVCNGLADGIVIGLNGRGRIEGNTIKGNVGCGIWVMGGQPLIQLNQIYNNNDTGVSFIQTRDVDEDLSLDGGEADSIASTSPVDFDGETTDSSATDPDYTDSDEPPHPCLKYNTIYHNNGFGVLAQCGEKILMQGNAVHSNHDMGVYVKQTLPVAVISNSITCNSGAGLLVSPDSKATLEGNGIYDNKGHGVHVQGEATLQANDVLSNQLSAVFVESSHACKVTNNRLHAPENFAVRVESTSTVTVKENIFFRGESALWNKDNLCGVYLSDCNSVVEQKAETAESNSPHSKRGSRIDWHLEDPPARPHIEAPPTVVPVMPTRSVTMVTRVTVPSVPGCQQFSRVCVIL